MAIFDNTTRWTKSQKMQFFTTTIPLNKNNYIKTYTECFPFDYNSIPNGRINNYAWVSNFANIFYTSARARTHTHTQTERERYTDTHTHNKLVWSSSHSLFTFETLSDYQITFIYSLLFSFPTLVSFKIVSQCSNFCELEQIHSNSLSHSVTSYSDKRYWFMVWCTRDIINGPKQSVHVYWYNGIK